MKTEYKEIFKLKRMLEKEGIPFDFVDRSVNVSIMTKLIGIDTFEHYQICYPTSGEDKYISVIEGVGTYGAEVDKLEIMGGITPYEEYQGYSPVIGYLTANNVFKRIKKHYNKEEY